MQLPPNVSPVSASFIGRQRQGIHRALIYACSRSLSCSCSWHGTCLCGVYDHTCMGDCSRRVSFAPQHRVGATAKLKKHLIRLFRVLTVGSPTAQEWKRALRALSRSGSGLATQS